MQRNTIAAIVVQGELQTPKEKIWFGELRRHDDWRAPSKAITPVHEQTAIVSPSRLSAKADAGDLIGTFTQSIIAIARKRLEPARTGSNSLLEIIQTFRGFPESIRQQKIDRFVFPFRTFARVL